MKKQSTGVEVHMDKATRKTLTVTTPLSTKHPYTAVVRSVTVEESKVSPSMFYISIELLIKGRILFGRICPFAAERFNSFFNALGVRMKSEESTDSLQRLVGRTCKVTLRNVAYGKRLFQDVDKFIRGGVKST
jgi:hypothetical protein